MLYKRCPVRVIVWLTRFIYRLLGGLRLLLVQVLAEAAFVFAIVMATMVMLAFAVTVYLTIFYSSFAPLVHRYSEANASD